MSPLLILTFLLITFLSLSFTASQVSLFASSVLDPASSPSSSYVSVSLDEAGEVAFTPQPVSNAVACPATGEEVEESSRSPNASHSFHAMQTSATFTMELMTQTVPWSTRSRPALLYQHTPTLYRNWQSNVQVSTGDHWLIMFEGSMNRGTNDSDANNENDVWASMDDGQTCQHTPHDTTLHVLTPTHVPYDSRPHLLSIVDVRRVCLV
jgi:hypothetical protein